MKRLTTKEAREVIARTSGGAIEGSQQSRFDDDAAWSGLLRWITTTESVPPYAPDSRRRDTYLSTIWRDEPHLAGVLSSVVDLDKNRAWTLLGGRNITLKTQRMMLRAEGGDGWRQYIGKQSLAYHTADIGFITETEREAIPGGLLNLYHVDPTRCRLVGGAFGELLYTDPRTGQQTWKKQERVDMGGTEMMVPADYFRGASMPSIQEVYNNLGYCSVSRALQLSQIMIGILGYDQEKLGVKAPQGLLILNGINQRKWEEAMAMRKAELEGREREWFDAVAVLASGGMKDIDAKLMALSQLPDQFDREKFIEFLIYGYALIFGYDAGEFWPKMRSGLGHGAETAVQHAKATRKGGKSFLAEFQSQLEKQLPATVEFEFTERDDQGRMAESEAAMAQLEVIEKLIDTGLVTIEQAQTLAAEQGLIKDEWTMPDEDITAKDTGQARIRRMREEARQKPQILANAMYTPDEPIVRYTYPSNEVITLWDRADHIFRPAIWQGHTARIQRATLFTDEETGLAITDEEVDRYISQQREGVDPTFRLLMEATPVN